MLPLFLLGILDLRLLGTSDLLHSVLALLALLSRHTLVLGHTVTDQSVLWLELLGEVKGIVDQSEAGALATTEDGAEAEAEYDIWLGLIHAGKLLSDLSLLDCGLAWMQNIDYLKINKTIDDVLQNFKRLNSE